MAWTLLAVRHDLVAVDRNSCISSHFHFPKNKKALLDLPAVLFSGNRLIVHSELAIQALSGQTNGFSEGSPHTVTNKHDDILCFIKMGRQLFFCIAICFTPNDVISANESVAAAMAFFFNTSTTFFSDVPSF
ncbi:hypothetical protein [Fictibacillus enclensis]|uniref:hypothetical protein n=1 Tax=Fictibacillus enclensis TaxID=1017270 RepID=UPI0024C0079A|nr:hypothetical protein [Fictibacillus enclensis]WHY73843.1 hypothetical protein QNH15_08040 [Fictibacillus enclensis]